jgi:hypothetical protein
METTPIITVKSTMAPNATISFTEILKFFIVPNPLPNHHRSQGPLFGKAAAPKRAKQSGRFTSLIPKNRSVFPR